MPATSTTKSEGRRHRPGPAAVYRLWDAQGNLLYIGSAYDPEQRCRGHRKKEWWSEVARRTDEWHPNRWTAYSAESDAVNAEKPKYNVMGSRAYQERCRQETGEGGRLRFRTIAACLAAAGASRDTVQAALRGEWTEEAGRLHPRSAELHRPRKTGDGS